jgi:hypothetical protein
MLITRIKTPKFKVGRYTLNEYELRQLQLEVAKGLKPAGIKVRSLSNGQTVSITENGHMDITFEDNSGYDLGSKISIEMWRIKKDKDKDEFLRYIKEDIVSL